MFACLNKSCLTYQCANKLLGKEKFGLSVEHPVGKLCATWRLTAFNSISKRKKIC